MDPSKFRILSVNLLAAILLFGCKDKTTSKITESSKDELPEDTVSIIRVNPLPLISDIYTADPSAHVFEGKLYIYPSHDFESGVPEDDLGSHFDMNDYHVFSMDSIGGNVTDHGVALHIKDVPWAGRQMWAPDAAEKNGIYYFYFPVKDKSDIFKIGVATSEYPFGPFNAKEQPIEGSFSMDPAVFEDTDGVYYMYFGGIWGGQLQRWSSGTYKSEDVYPAEDQMALTPKIAKLTMTCWLLQKLPQMCKYLIKMEVQYWQVIMNDVSLKLHGFISTMESIIYPIQQVTLIISHMVLVIILTVLLPTRESF